MKYFYSIFFLISCLIHYDKGAAQNLPDFEKAPVLSWKFSTKGAIVANPVIENNIIYIGSADSTLYALEKSSGKIKWKFHTGGQVRSTVCIDAERLFVLSGSGILFCLKKSTGEVQWAFRAFNGYMGDRINDFADYYYSSPQLYKGKIFFGSGNTIFALNASNGEFVWSYLTEDVVHTQPAFHNDKLFIGSFDGHLYALHIHTGHLLWKFKSTGHRYFPKGEMMGNPVVTGSLVLIGSRDYHLYAIHVNGGYCHWVRQFPKGWALPATARDSVIYLGTSDDRQLLALDQKSGETRWKIDAKFNIFGGCAFSKTMGYFGTLMGRLLAFDLKTGTVRWAMDSESYQKNNLKYLKADDSYRDDIGSILAQPADVLKMYSELGGFFCTPALSEDWIILASYDGTVVGLKKQG